MWAKLSAWGNIPMAKLIAIMKSRVMIAAACKNESTETQEKTENRHTNSIREKQCTYNMLSADLVGIDCPVHNKL